MLDRKLGVPATEDSVDITRTTKSKVPTEALADSEFNYKQLEDIEDEIRWSIVRPKIIEAEDDDDEDDLRATILVTESCHRDSTIYEQNPSTVVVFETSLKIRNYARSKMLKYSYD